MVALILTFKFVNTAKALRYCKRIDQICYLEKNIEQPREYTHGLRNSVRLTVATYNKSSHFSFVSPHDFLHKLFISI